MVGTKTPHSVTSKEYEVCIVFRKSSPFGIFRREHFLVESGNTIGCIEKVPIGKITPKDFQDQFNPTFDFVQVHIFLSMQRWRYQTAFLRDSTPPFAGARQIYLTALPRWKFKRWSSMKSMTSIFPRL